MSCKPDPGQRALFGQNKMCIEHFVRISLNSPPCKSLFAVLTHAIVRGCFSTTYFEENSHFLRLFITFPQPKQSFHLELLRKIWRPVPRLSEDAHFSLLIGRAQNWDGFWLVEVTPTGQAGWDPGPGVKEQNSKIKWREQRRGVCIYNSFNRGRDENCLIVAQFHSDFIITHNIN